MTKARLAFNSGFSLIEALLAGALFSLLSSVIVGALIFGQESTALSGARNRAAFLAEEGFEAARNLRDETFANLTAGAHGLATSSGQWAFSGTSDTTDIFKRAVTIGTIDTRRQAATSTVSYKQTVQRSATTTLETTLTDWRRDFGNWALPVQQSTSNFSGNANASKVALYRTGGSTYAVAVRVASTDSELFVVDVSNPASLTQVGSLQLSDSPSDVAVVGNLAVLATPSNTQELMVIDLTNVSAPTLVGSLDLAGNENALSIAASGTVAFLGRANAAAQEVYAISLANPAAPALLSTLETGTNITKLALAQNGQYLYAGTPSGTQELMIISVANSSSISLTGSFNAAGSNSGTAVAVFSTYAVLGQNNGNVLIISAANPASPTLVGSLDIGAAVIDLAMGVGDLYIFVGSSTNLAQITVVSAETLTAPVIFGVANLAGNTINGVVWDFDLNRVFGAGIDNANELVAIRPS